MAPLRASTSLVLFHLLLTVLALGKPLNQKTSMEAPKLSWLIIAGQENKAFAAQVQ